MLVARLLILTALSIPGTAVCQVIASFQAPDTVCTGTTVQINNTSVNQTTNYWNFCVANLNGTPVGNNLGNIGNQFQMPVFIDYAFDNGNYYAFQVNNFPGGLVRLNFGSSLLNTPTATNLGSVGVIPNHAEGIQVVKQGSDWFVIIVGGEAASGVQPRIVKIALGPNIANNAPVGTDWGNLGNLGYPHDLFITQDNGIWVGLTVNTANNTLTRFNFGSDFTNPPSATNLGNPGNLTGPTGLHALKYNNNWHIFVASANSSTISRIDFGNSLLNAPTGINLGNISGNFHSCWDLTVIEFCGEVLAFVINANTSFNDIVRLNFGTNILGIPTATSIGNIGNMNFPHCISKIFRVNADLYAFIPNVINNTLTRIQFTGCNNASIPNSSLQTPPPITYNTPGTYNINLTVDDGLPTQTSFCKKIVVVPALDFDFNYQRNLCNPLTVQFNGIGNSISNPYWLFGDGNFSTSLNPNHTYTLPGNYIVKYKVGLNGCTDTVTKTLSLSIIDDNIILTPDTTICRNGSRQLNSIPSLGFCWSPTTYLNDPLSPNPTTTTPVNITYYLIADVQGNNLIVNGDFNAGNSGFTSDYNYANPNTTEGQYYVGTNPPAWNGGLSNCGDHSPAGTGNMMMINGSPVADQNVWKQTVSVLPNTNYAFSTWIQALHTSNPALLQFSINGNDLSPNITASLPTCTWTRFYTTWNSGNNTTATIAIVNKNVQVAGNDFALDDISFASVFTKRDSVKITIDDPVVQTIADLPVCKGSSVNLAATGANSYQWTPVTGLNNPSISNPVATPAVTTQYIVTGTSISGCMAKDSVTITVNNGPTVTSSRDTSICPGSSIQLFASGGVSYSWSPAGTLDNPNIPNPVATPMDSTTYYVTVTGPNTCQTLDSVIVDVGELQNASVNPAAAICLNDSLQLSAAGGHVYLWSGGPLNNPSIPNPTVNPLINTNYSVLITDTICNNSVSLSTLITVWPLPTISADKSNDLDCSIDFSRLNAAGALTYNWTPVTTLSNPQSQTPIARPASTTQYIVTGIDNKGCKNSDSVTVYVTTANKGGYFMPTAFTPNNDGLNDCYGVKLWGSITEFEFSIYNRWGQRIFFTTQPGDCWDGKIAGKEQTTDVFVYVIKAKTQCEPIVFRKGIFTLIR